VAWNYLVFGLSKSSTLIMTVVVARLLTPADFGLFALVVLVVGLFDYVKDLGVAGALVQSPRAWNRLAPTGLILSIVFGVAAAAALAITAPLTAALLQRPELGPMMQVLAIGLAISAVSAVPAAWLRRSLDFKRRVVPEFVGAATKAAVTITLAAAGSGVWSLVYGQLAGTVLLSAAYWWVARVPPVLDFDRTEARNITRFGLRLTGINVVAFGILNVDYLAIGYRLGEEQLGLYTLAYRLPELLVLNVCAVVSEVLFSSLSRLQRDQPRLTEHYLQVASMVAAVTVPMSTALAAAAPAVIGTLYGPAYAGAAPVLAVLALYTLVYSASYHAGDLFKASNRPTLLSAISAGKLALMIGPVWWGASHGIVAVALVLVVAGFLAAVANLLVVRAVVGIPLRLQAKAAMQPLPASACMGAVILGVSHATAPLPQPAILAVSLIAGLLTYLAGLRLTAPQIARAALTSLRAARQRRTGPLNGHVRKRVLGIARRYPFTRNQKDALHK
jgi:PST family polysaccharide transporter